MDSQPTFTIRNIAEPRKFVTKWATEQDKKVQRKKAFSRERDTKYSTFQDSPEFEEVQLDHDYDYSGNQQEEFISNDLCGGFRFYDDIIFYDYYKGDGFRFYDDIIFYEYCKGI